MCACENGGTPPLPYWEGNRHFGRGGETSPPLRGETLPFSKVLGGMPRPVPGVAAAYVRAGWRRSRTGAGRLRMGGEEECAQTGDSNPGCNYLVRGYSPSMHFFWGGDMPHYSNPLPFWQGRAGCPCVLASPRGQQLLGSRTCRLAGVPRPVPQVVAAYVCAGRQAPGCAQGRDRGCATWLAGPRLRSGSRPSTCALAGRPAPLPGTGVMVVCAGHHAHALGLVHALAPTRLRQPHTFRQSVLPF